jgi:hypothetical protein
VNYGVAWDHEAWEAFLDLYAGDEMDANDAVAALEWRLSRDPALNTVEIPTPVGQRFVTWIGPYKYHPAVGLAFRIEHEEFRHNCVIERVRRTNVPDGLS